MVKAVEGTATDARSNGQTSGMSLDEIANLVGYTPADANGSEVNGNGVAEDTSEDDLNLDEFSDDEGVELDVSPTPTGRKLHQNPIVKFLFIGSLTGLLFFGLGFFLKSMNKVDVVGEPKETTGSREDEESPEERALRLKEQELGDLKTANALGNQSQALEYQQSQSEIQSRRRPPVTTTVADASAARRQSNASSTSSSSSPPQPQPAVRPVDRTPTPRPAAAPVRQPSRTQPAVVTPRPAPSTTPSPRFSERPAEPEVDPNERWQQLLAMGSYGSIDYSDDIQSAAPAVEAVSTTAGQPVEVPVAVEGGPVGIFVAHGKSEADEDVPVEVEAVEPRSGNVPVEETEASEEAQIQDAMSVILGEPEEGATVVEAVETIPGQRVGGVLLTPIVMAAGTGASQEAIIEVTEDLIADDFVVIPAGTQIISEVESVDQTGLVDLVITAVVMPPGSEDIQMDIHGKSFQIRGEAGEPLIAELYRDESELRSLELSSAAIGALGNVGAILNRPDSETTIVNSNTSVSSTDNGDANILGALLEGAAQAIVEPRQARIAAATQEIMSRPEIWFIDAGKEVEIMVSEGFVVN
ncbi:MAG: TrbI/VirB10 family protein [Cyanobacteria bacterium P01_G01_bin.38]